MADEVQQGQVVRSGRDLLPLFRDAENSGDDATSPKGAIGRYQIMPGTARHYGFDPGRLAEPAYNEQVAETVLNDLNRRYRGDVDAIAVAYNAGPSVANRWLRNGKSGGLPAETLKYLDRAQQFVKVNGSPLDLPEQQVKTAEADPAPARRTTDGQVQLKSLQDGGFSAQDILQFKQDQTQKLLGGGFTPQDIEKYWGETPPDPAKLDAAHQRNLAAVPPDQAITVAKNPWEALGAGWDMSVTGLMANNAAPKVGLGPDASLGQKIMQGAGQIAGDIPFNVAGGIIGAGGTAETGPGAIVGGGAGALALPQAMREVMLDYYKRGEVRTSGEFLRMAAGSVWSTLKAGIVGAVTAGAGKLAAPLAPNALGPIVAAPVMALTGTTVSSALEGHIPDDSDFIAGAVLAVGTGIGVAAIPGGKGKASGSRNEKVADNLRDIYEKTGVPPWEAAARAKTDPIFRQEVMAEDPSGNPVYPTLHLNGPDEPARFQERDVRVLDPEKGGGKEPPKPPEGDDITPPEPKPKGVGGPAPLSEDVLNEMASEFIGQPPKPDSELNPSRLYRQWVSELGPARAIDKMLIKQGFDTKTQLGIEDMFRQTYASDTRAGYFVLKGGIDPITLEHRADVPAIMDAVRAVKSDGGKLSDWINYMVAKRAVEKEAQGLKSGHTMDADQLTKLIAYGDPKYTQATALMQKTNDGALEYGRLSGVFSTEQVARMKEANQIYISYRRVMGDNASVPAGRGGKRGFRVREPVRTFEGDDRQITDPMLATIDNIHQIVRMADRNRAIGAVIELAKRGGLTELLGLKQIDAPEIKATIAEPGSDVFKPYLPENVSSEPYAPFLAVRAMRHAFGANDTRFLYLNNGKPEIWTAATPELAALLRGADSPGEANLVLSIATGLAKIQRLGIVTAPDFPIRNVMRDQITAFILDPNSPPPFVTWLRGAMHAFKMDETYWDWVRKGGAGTALAEMDKNVLARDMQQVFTDTGVWGKMWNTVQHPLEAMMILSERIDAGSRIGATEMLKSEGVVPIKAATMGRKAYLDFAERGTHALMQWWSRTTPFLRPSVLGMKQLAEGVKENPGGTLLKTIAAVTLPTIILYGLNYMQDEYGDLPEDQKFKNLPRWQKDMMYVLPSVGGVRIRIPYPFLVGPVFGGLVTRFLDKMVQDDPKAFQEWWQTAVAQLVPSIIPAVALPVLETVTNHNFFTGHPLIPDSLKDASGDMQYTENTTEAAKALARVVAPIGPMSPIMFEDYVRNWSGSVGMAALRAVSAPFKQEGKPWEMADYPFVGSFLVRNPGASAQPIQDFYDDANAMQTILKDRSLARRRLVQGSQDGAPEFDQAYQQQAIRLSGISQAITTMKSVVIGVNNDKTMTVDEKRQMTDMVYGNMITTAKMGSELVKTMKAQPW